MDTIQDKEDLIQTFLHIHYPNIDDKPYYDVDFEKNILNLYDPIYKIKTEKNSIFELNKIFTNENDNKYIYEETCSNTIKDCLNGQSIVFISYGITISDKLKFIIGDVNDSYSNLNHRGIFPILLDKLISSLNNSKYSKYNYSINLSYMCFYDQKIIDLSNLLGKDFSSFTEENILKFGVELDKKIGGVSNIKKVPTENCNDVLFFINKLFSLLIKLEEDSFYNLYSRSHFVFIIYIINNDGKIISTLTFILLNGSENLNIHNRSIINNKQMNKDGQEKLLENAKCAHDSQFTYDSIIYSLQNNIYINQLNVENIFGEKEDNIKHLNKNDVEIDEIEKINLSKLTRVLYEPIFSRKVNNIKFKIIGSILPNTGYYDLVKDTLMFLFRCRKIIIAGNRKKKEGLFISKSKKKSISNSKSAKDDTMFELENKIKLQAMKIEDMHKMIDKKQEKIAIIEKNYRKQIEVLKKNLGFSGNIEILLSGNENTKEFIEAKNTRDALENLKLNKLTINDFERKLENANQEIKKLKNLLVIKENDKTMLRCYHSINDSKKKKKVEDKNRNDFYEKIENYERELKQKEKMITELQKELETKNKILLSIPNYFRKNNKTNNINNINNISKNNETISIKSEEKNTKNPTNTDNNKKVNTKNNVNISLDSDSPLEIKPKEKIYKEKLCDVLKRNQTEIQIITKKYESLLHQKEEIIKDNNYQIKKLQKQNKYEISMFEEELMKMNKLLMKIFSNYRKIFPPFFNEKLPLVTLNNKREEFEKLLANSEKEINGCNFPLLYKIFFKKGNDNSKIINKKNSIDNSKNKEKYKTIETDHKTFMEKNFINFEKSPSPSIEQMKEFLNEQSEDVLSIKKLQLEKMTKDELIEAYLKSVDIIHDIEKYFKKYTNYKRGFLNKEDNKEELLNKINTYQNKIKTLEKSLENAIQKNNKNDIIIDSQNRIIDNFKKNKCKNLFNSKNNGFSSESKFTLRKNSDKYPLYNLYVNSNGKHIHTSSENNLGDLPTFSKNSAKYKLMRHNTDSSVNYQPTNGTSYLATNLKTSFKNIENGRTKKPKRPYTSTNKYRSLNEES